MNAGASVPEPAQGKAALAVALSRAGGRVAAELAPPEPEPAPMTAAEERAAAAAEELSLLRAANLTGFKHVSRNGNPNKPFQASLMRGGHHEYLGFFATAEEAALAVGALPPPGCTSPSRPRARRARSPVPTRHCAGTR